MPLKFTGRRKNRKIVYECTQCGAKDCKLWRDYNAFLKHQELYCVTCAGKAQDKDVSSMDAEGYRESEYGKTDQIGWLVPAVPTKEYDTFWGYTSVPQDLVDWWRALPTFPVKEQLLNE